MKKLFTVLVMLCMSCNSIAMAYDTRNTPELFRSYGKEQIRTKDSKGNWIVVTPNYRNAEERNKHVSEKIVAIYDKHSPAFGYKYVIYTPIGNYIGYHKVMQPSMNGYGFEGIPSGDVTGVSDETPCFYNIKEAINYYYPNHFKGVSNNARVPIVRN